MTSSIWKPVPRLVVAGLLFSVTSHAAAPAGRYVSGTGTLQDSKTGLTWEQPATMKLGWVDAKAYCNGKGASWRLPTIKELVSLIDFNGATTDGVHIDPLFAPTAGDTYYWSSTIVAGSSSTAWAVSFGAPGPSGNDLAALAVVRCVR